NPIGEHIQINGTNFQVVGLFKSAQSGERGEEETQRIYVPFTTFQKSFNYGTFVSWFAISAYPRGDAIALEEKTLAILKDRHTIAPDDERAFGHWNMARQFREIENVFFGINALSWIVGTLTLLAGAIGISNIMLVVVKERTKEIGIRRAIGATPFSIVSLIVAESIFLTVLAGYLGLLLGFGILETYAYLKESIGFDTGMFGIPNLELGLAIQALLILVVAGIFAGLLPAYRAISIPPVDALRTD
ncbi:MAG: ABC transporter permease, partial [Bacteroidota bacterium]